MEQLGILVGTSAGGTWKLELAACTCAHQRSREKSRAMAAGGCAADSRGLWTRRVVPAACQQHGHGGDGTRAWHTRVVRMP